MVPIGLDPVSVKTGCRTVPGTPVEPCQMRKLYVQSGFIHVQFLYKRLKITAPAVTIHCYLPTYLHHNCTTSYKGGTQYNIYYF